MQVLVSIQLLVRWLENKRGATETQGLVPKEERAPAAAYLPDKLPKTGINQREKEVLLSVH